jgi:tol-pal system protein YbgF
MLALAAIASGCSAGSQELERENEELRRMLTETRTDLEAVRRDQEQLRSTVEYLQHARGKNDRGTAEPGGARWPADPWSSPDPFSVPPPASGDLNSMQPGQAIPGSVSGGMPPTRDDIAGLPSTPPMEPRPEPLPPVAALPPLAPPPAAAAPPAPSAPPSGATSSNSIVASVRGSGAGAETGTLGVQTPPPIVPEALSGSLYDAGVRAFNGGRYDEAVQHFRDYIHKEPQSAQADDAQFWIGESNLRKGQYSNAIKEFNQVVLRYASGDRSAASLLKLAEVFSKIGDQVDARLSLQKLVNRYPGSTEAAEAYRLLQEMGG